MNIEEPDLLSLAATWRDAGHKVALATVVRTFGSSPRRPGSQLVIREDGYFEGSVSGGCVEGEVVQAAQQAMVDGKVQRLTFGVTNEDAWQAGLACGGEVEIFVEAVQ